MPCVAGGRAGLLPFDHHAVVQAATIGAVFVPRSDQPALAVKGQVGAAAKAERERTRGQRDVERLAGASRKRVPREGYGHGCAIPALPLAGIAYGLGAGDEDKMLVMEFG